jgi:ABC-2 type transport system ATP-binding protein
MEEAEHVCDHVGIIDYGRIITLGTPEELKDLLGGYLVVMRVKDPPLDSIRDLPYVSGVKLNDGIVEITMKEAHLHLPDLLSRIRNVESVETRAPTLNDVFIKLTGRDIREEYTEDTGDWIESAVRYRQRGN